MSQYLEDRSEKLKVLHNIYNIEPMEMTQKFTEFKELSRISKISQNKGVELSKFNIFPYKYTLLDHSYGIALILDNFKQSPIHILEAILHEIATPAFRDGYSYLKSYFKITSKLEPEIFNYIVASDSLFEGFFKGQVSIDEIQDYKKFHLGFADFPRLSAKNLEYILYNAFFTGICELEEIKDFYYDLSIGLSEYKTEEFCFSDLTLAKKFFKLSLEIGKKYRSYESKITLRYLADILMLMVRREDLDLKEFFILNDVDIIKKGKNSTDKRIKDAWNTLENLDKVDIKFNPIEDKEKYCVKVSGRAIYIDPLIKTKDGIFRLSHIDKSVDYEIEVFTSVDTDMYMYINHEL